MTRLLTERDVTAVLAYDELHRELEDCFRGWHTSAVRHGPRDRLGTLATRLHVLSGAAAGYVGVKAYSAQGHGQDHVVLLYDDADGHLAAVVAATELGAIRTGVASAVATRHQHGDTRVLAVIGSGLQAITQARAIAADNTDLAEIRIYSRTTEKRASCAAELAAALDGHGCTVHATDTTADACAGADVICTATSSAVPVLDSEHVAAGTHVNAAGSNSLARVEVTASLLERSTVVVDSRDQARREAGDLLALAETGRVDWRQLPELGEIVTGSRQPLPVGGADGDRDVTVFESLGLGVFDLVAAALALRRAEERGLGTDIHLS